MYIKCDIKHYCYIFGSYFSKNKNSQNFLIFKLPLYLQFFCELEDDIGQKYFLNILLINTYYIIIIYIILL